MGLVKANPINWDNLTNALFYYKKLGYTYLELPWYAPTDIMHITFSGEYRFKTTLGDPVGSGEQSFLHVQFNEGLEPGKYIALTPCFRDEPETQWNFKQFAKVELYLTEDVTEWALTELISSCALYLAHTVGCSVEVVPMPDGSYDLTAKGIELGSYGIREARGHRWIYGTGLAEPRTSMVKELCLTE